MNERSLKRLQQAHPDLRRLFLIASRDAPVAFEIGEALRTVVRQKQLFTAGASQTMNSRHLPHPADGLSRACDFVCYVGGKLRWDWPLYLKMGEHFKGVASKLGIAIVWGGDWKSLRDGPHIELSRKQYP